MKNLLIFLLGMVAGAIVTVYVYEPSDSTAEDIAEKTEKSMKSGKASKEKTVKAKNKEDQNTVIKMLDEPGEIIPATCLEIREIMENGYARASVYSSDNRANMEMYDGIDVVLSNKEGSLYDNQKIRIASGKCVRKTGIMKYRNYSYLKFETLPIVKIMEK